MPDREVQPKAQSSIAEDPVVFKDLETGIIYKTVHELFNFLTSSVSPVMSNSIPYELRLNRAEDFLFSR